MKALAFIVKKDNVSNERRGEEPKIPLAEMDQLYALGYHLIPCGGEDGKKPLRKKWNGDCTKRMPLETVIRIMQEHNSCTYGVRLDGLAVVDCDSWDEATRNYVRDKFPETALKVTTSRGRHFYFQSGDPMPNATGLENVKIDFKGGRKHFVVGPGSVRPDGKAYTHEIDQFPCKNDLSPFRFLGAAQDLNSQIAPNHLTQGVAGRVIPTQAFTQNLIKKGERNRAAFKQACNLATDGLSLVNIIEHLSLWVDIHCEDPGSFHAAEIKKTCVSACKLRKEGKLYRGRKSEFKIARSAFDLVRFQCGKMAANCWLLYSFLTSNHGHVPNKPFAIVAEAIAKSAHLPLSKSTIDRCKQELKRVGLIKLLRKGKHLEPDQFVLTPLAQIIAET